MRFVKWAIGVVVVLVVIGASLFVFGKGNAIFGNSKTKMTQIASQSKNMEFKEYDNQNVIGADVVYAADLFSTRPQFSVLVKTKNVPAGFNAANTSASTQVCYTAATPSVAGTCTPVAGITVSTMNDTTHADYVNPTAMFTSQLFYDANDVVRTIVFTQK